MTPLGLPGRSGRGKARANNPESAGLGYPLRLVGEGLEVGLPRLFPLPVDWVLLAQHGFYRPLEV